MTVCFHKRSLTLTNAVIAGIGVYAILSLIVSWLLVDNHVIRIAMSLYMCIVLLPIQFGCCIFNHFQWKWELKRIQENMK